VTAASLSALQRHVNRQLHLRQRESSMEQLVAKPIIVGQGPIRVIAMHGWFGSASAWRPFAEVVDTRNFTYVFPDYRGYGTRVAETGDYTIQEIADDTIALADELHWSTFNLVGHSMGGKAIQQVLLNAPARVEKLVAVTPVPASGVPFDEATWSFFSKAWNDRGVREAIIDNTTGSRLSKAWVSKMAAHSFNVSRPEAFAAYLDAWAKGDFSAAVQGNPVPIKVIVGKHDPALSVTVMQSTYMRWYPNAELEILENAGHYPMDETPVALASSIERFLAGKA